MRQLTLIDCRFCRMNKKIASQTADVAVVPRFAYRGVFKSVPAYCCDDNLKTTPPITNRLRCKGRVGSDKGAGG